MQTVLVVDDEPKIVQLARDYLEHAGFAVLTAGDGAVRAARGADPPARPRRPRPRAARRSTASRSCGRSAPPAPTPIVVLTARDTELDTLLGLELGADDYMTKPFSPRELVARVRAVLRRGAGARPSRATGSTPATSSLDVPRLRATVAGRPVDLTATEFAILAAMAREPGRVFTRAQLLDAVHGVAFESYERAIDAHVKNIRRKLEPDPSRPQLPADRVRRRLSRRRVDRRRGGLTCSRVAGRPGGPRTSRGPRRAGPPSDGPGGHRGGRHSGGMRRGFGCFMAVMSTLVVSVGVLVLWLLASLLGLGCRGPARGPRSSGGLVVLVAGLIALVIGIRLARGVGRPLSELVDAAGRIEAADYSVRVPEPERGRGDLRGLGRAFNSMAARLESEDATRRRLLADVSHELRTPLAVIQGNLEALLDGVYPADEAHLGPILDETKVLERLIDDLRTLSLAESGALPLHREPTDIAAMLEDVATSHRTRPEATGATIEVVVDAEPPLPQLDVDPVRIRQVVSNLVENSLRHARWRARSG